jgi:L-alanine-DL-glutamate epimerase-like enolase superfamily enzyme
MKITKLETFTADGGWRPFSFLKMTTDAGLVGWAEFTESQRNKGLGTVILGMGDRVIGRDPTAWARITAILYAGTRLSYGGINQQAIAAIENCCLDIAAQAAGVPVYALFGGALRERVPLYWSHCGNFRVRHAKFFTEQLGVPPLDSLDAVKALGREVRARGYNAAKTSPVIFGKDGIRTINPGFIPVGMDFAWRADAEMIDAIGDQLAAFREGLGDDASLMMDVNFSFRPEALRRVVRAAEPAKLTWMEMDLHDPAALAAVRAGTTTPIASYETLFGRRAYRPYFEAQAADVAIIDVAWNGLAESVRIASQAESYDVNVAPHNANGPLHDLMSAHFAAAVPNLHIMEIEVDDVPWKDEFITVPRVIEKGELVVPTGAGWGATIDEEALAARPWKPH